MRIYLEVGIDLDDIDDDVIREYAEDKLGMYTDTNTIGDYDDEDLIDELGYRGVYFQEEIASTVSQTILLEEFYEVFDRIPESELQALINKYK